VLVSQTAGDVSHIPGSRLPLLSARPAVTLTTLRGLLPISLLGEQRHDDYFDRLFSSLSLLLPLLVWLLIFVSSAV